MTTISTLPMFVSHTRSPRDSPDGETRMATVTVPCTGLNSTFLDDWVQQEHISYLELLQAAWTISLRSYTGSDDVGFSCLRSQKYVVQCIQPPLEWVVNSWLICRSWYCHVSTSKPVRTLFDIQRVDLDEEHSTTFPGANSVVYVNDGHEDEYDSARLDDDLEAVNILSPKKRIEILEY